MFELMYSMRQEAEREFDTTSDPERLLELEEEIAELTLWLQEHWWGE